VAAAPAKVTKTRPEPQVRFDLVKRLRAVKPPATDTAASAWKVWQCRCGEATFFLGLSLEDEEPMSGGAGRLWVPTRGAAGRLAKAAVSAFRSKRKEGQEPTQVPPGMLVMVLAGGKDEAGEGGGSWTHSKWTGEEGAPEFYVNWSEKEKRGAIREKDAFFRRLLLDMLATLPVRP
jgi:hypothetical protein